ncbi:MAG: nucleotidyltransferase domain-containing protein [Candidatus Thermoplasmatota archaeon]|nr:nucleotidyltransferase domain-containing protein [Candidatus Thermoplasmatota archaeon]
MITKDITDPLLDFVSQADTVPNLTGMILFGSAVTGKMSKKSDIDIVLIFETAHDPETGQEAEMIHEIASTVSVKHDLLYPFSFVFINKNNMKEVDADFLWTIAKEGIIIWGKPNELLMNTPHPSLKPMMLIQYSTKNLDEKDKRKLLRWLYTSKQKMINKNKEKIGLGVLLVKAQKFDELKKVFDMFNLTYSIKKIWSH